MPDKDYGLYDGKSVHKDESKLPFKAFAKKYKEYWSEFPDDTQEIYLKSLYRAAHKAAGTKAKFDEATAP